MQTEQIMERQNEIKQKNNAHKQSHFCVYKQTHYSNYKLPARNFTTFLYLLVRVRNCNKEIVNKTCNPLLFYLIDKT